MSVSLTLLLLLGLFAFYWVALCSLIRGLFPCLILSFVLLGCSAFGGLHFSEEETEGTWKRGRGEVGGARRDGERGTVVGMYCMKDESILNIKKKRKRKIP